MVYSIYTYIRTCKYMYGLIFFLYYIEAHLISDTLTVHEYFFLTLHLKF